MLLTGRSSRRAGRRRLCLRRGSGPSLIGCGVGRWRRCRRGAPRLRRETRSLGSQRHDGLLKRGRIQIIEKPRGIDHLTLRLRRKPELLQELSELQELILALS